MKRSLFIRRLIAEIAVLAVILVSANIYLEKKEEFFLKEFRTYLLNRINKSLDVQLEIIKMDGGFIDNISLQNVKITKQLDANYTIVFEANCINVYYRLWRMALDKIPVLKPVQKFIYPLKEVKIDIQNARFYFAGAKPFVHNFSGSVVVREDSLHISSMTGFLWKIPLKVSGSVSDLYKNPALDMNLMFERGPIEGSFNIGGTFKAPSIAGGIKIYDKILSVAGKLSQRDAAISLDELVISDNICVNGFLDLAQHICKLNISVSDNNKTASGDSQIGAASLSFDFARTPYVKTDIKLDHIKIGSTDLVSDIAIKTDIKIKDSKLDYIKSELATSKTIVNYKPFNEIDAFLEFSDSIFRIVYFKLGDSYNVSGTVDFSKQPYEINCRLFLNKALLNDLAMAAGVSTAEDVPGNVTAKIDFLGTVNHLTIRGSADLKDGLLADIKYNSMALDLEGVSPVIDIKEARVITKEGGTLVLDGKIDLRKLASGDAIEMKLKQDQQNIMLAGFDIEKEPASNELSIGKTLGENLRLNFKTYTNKDETSFYQGKAPADKIKEDEQFFGVEQKLKF